MFYFELSPYPNELDTFFPESNENGDGKDDKAPNKEANPIDSKLLIIIMIKQDAFILNCNFRIILL